MIDSPHGPERAGAEAAAEALDAGEADTRDLDRVAVEQVDAAITQHLADGVVLTRFVVVVAEHGHDRHVHALRQRPEKSLGFLDPAVIGQVAADGEDVRLRGGAGEQRRVVIRRMPSVMEVGDRSDSDRRGGVGGVVGYRVGSLEHEVCPRYL